MRRFIPLVIVSVMTLLSARHASAAFDPTTGYSTVKVQGWTVKVNKKFQGADPVTYQQVMDLLNAHLTNISRAVPFAALNKLKQVNIWVEQNDVASGNCMVYHPNKQWLIDHGVNPDKALCVEIANARNFLDWWKDQPYMVLHEMSHAYHHRFLPNGFANADVKAAYDRIIADGRYDLVERISGTVEPAYAKTNEMEFFAEVSEAFFGTNDFYPFVRSELNKHDPETYALLQFLWGA
jgi:hypothetical protein